MPKKITYYDPPTGWRFGFPKVYNPRPNENIKDTLIRDGYPEKDAEFGAQHCRFFSMEKE